MAVRETPQSHRGKEGLAALVTCSFRIVSAFLVCSRFGGWEQRESCREEKVILFTPVEECGLHVEGRWLQGSIAGLLSTL